MSEKKVKKENESKVSDKKKEKSSSREKLKKELEECLQRSKELEDYAKRSKAALENLRKEKDEEIKDAVDYANKKIVEELIYVLDDMERLLENFSDKKSLEYDALKIIYNKFKDILISEGLKEIESKGKFDPFDHDAVERVESSIHEDWDIVEVVQKGYKFRSRLIRPAKVKVAVHKANVSEKEGDKNDRTSGNEEKDGD